MATDARLTLSVDSSQVKVGEKSLNELTKAGARAEDQVEDLSSAASGLGTPIRGATTGFKNAANESNRFSNSARNLSLQLGQVVQQGSATGNFAQALAIQLPDLLLTFGTLGIAVGAVAGLIGTQFVNASIEAQKESSNLSEEIDELSANFDELGIKQRELLRFKIADEAAKAAIENRKLSGSIETAKFQLNRLINEYDRGRVDVLEFNEREAELNKTIREGESTIEGNNARLEERRKLLDGSAKAAEEAAKREADASRERERLTGRVESLRGLDPVVRAEQEFDARSQVIKDALAQDIITAQEFQLQDEANYKAYQERLTQIAKSSSDQRSMLMSAEQQGMLSMTGQLFGNLAQIAQAGGEDQFQTYKNLASAQAGIAASLAVIKALAEGGPVLGPILATSIGALAAVQIAQIQAQEYQPRALGGQMRAGGSYLVGERGPELITMGNRNANITPNNQLGGNMSNNVTQVFQISAGVQGTVRSEILAAVPLIKKVASQTVISESRKGGAMSRAVGAR